MVWFPDHFINWTDTCSFVSMFTSVAGLRSLTQVTEHQPLPVSTAHSPLSLSTSLLCPARRSACCRLIPGVGCLWSEMNAVWVMFSHRMGGVTLTRKVSAGEYAMRLRWHVLSILNSQNNLWLSTASCQIWIYTPLKHPKCLSLPKNHLDKF